MTKDSQKDTTLGTFLRTADEIAAEYTRDGMALSDAAAAALSRLWERVVRERPDLAARILAEASQQP